MAKGAKPGSSAAQTKVPLNPTTANKPPLAKNPKSSKLPAK